MGLYTCEATVGFTLTYSVLTMRKDALSMNATFEDWQQVMGPKVTGAWNLRVRVRGLVIFDYLKLADLYT